MIAIAALASCFSGCGEQRYLITLKDGTKVLDTILTDKDGFADPWANEYPKAGYEFVGWYKDVELKNEYDKSRDKFWGNGTLYCKRESLEYTVTFMPGGGEFPASTENDGTEDSVEKPTRPTEKPTEVRQTPALDTDGNYTLKVRSGETLLVTKPEREHYDFAGWRCNGELVDEKKPYDRAQDVTYVAVWQAHRSAITYEANGGTIYTDTGAPVTSATVRQYVDYDAAFTPYTAEKKGYSFGGWWYTEDKRELELKAVDKWQTETNYTVTAHFTANKYNVAILTADGKYVNKEVTFDAAYDFTEYSQAPDGYVFDRWEYELDGVTGTVAAKGVWDVAGHVTLMPRYNANDYKLTLIVGGEVYDSSTVAFGSPVILPDDPTRSGKVFVGWFEKADGTGERLLPGDYWRWSDAQEKTFYARFAPEATAIPFTVEYYLERADHIGAELADIYERQEESYTAYGTAGEKITVDVSGFGGKFENCGFDAHDSLNGVTQITLTAGVPATLKFYFKRDTVMYSFIDEGASVRSNKYRVGQTIDLADIVTKEGYELTGWRTETGEFIAADAVYCASAADTLLTAVWKLKTYSVLIDGEFAFDVQYGAELTEEMRKALLLSDTEISTFDGLSGNGGRLSPDDLAAMKDWKIDGGKRTADGKFSLAFKSLWKARKANYTVELWLEGEDGNYARSDLYSFMKKADIGSTITFEVGKNIIESFTAADGTVYVFNAAHEGNALTLTVTDDNAAAVRLYYDRAAA